MADESNASPAQAQDLRPIPDPTALTTALVDRALKSERELVNAKLDGLKDLHEQKFAAVQLQFSERDTRSEQTARDSKLTVDTAFDAAKEAVAEQNKSSAEAIKKSEAATEKQIDRILDLINTNERNATEKITDLKERLAIDAGRGQGQGAVWGFIVGGVGVVAAVIGIIAAIVK